MIEMSRVWSLQEVGITDEPETRCTMFRVVERFENVSFAWVKVQKLNPSLFEGDRSAAVEYPVGSEPWPYINPCYVHFSVGAEY